MGLPRQRWKGLIMAVEILVEAPNFNGSAYPGTGERIGPAWRWMWSVMGDGRWRCGADFADEVASMVWGPSMDPTIGGRLSPKTVTNLLEQAKRLGLLTMTKRRPIVESDERHVFRSYYARTDILEWARETARERS